MDFVRNGVSIFKIDIIIMQSTNLCHFGVAKFLFLESSYFHFLANDTECSYIDCNYKCDDIGDFVQGDKDEPVCTKCCEICDIVECEKNCNDAGDFEAGDDDEPACTRCCGNIINITIIIIIIIILVM